MGFGLSENSIDERAEVAIQKIMSKGLAVVPCNPDPRIETSNLIETQSGGNNQEG
jgi:hypothetical protein